MGLSLRTRVHVMTIGRSNSGINKAEDDGTARGQISSTDALQRVLPTTVSSFEFRGWVRQETLRDRSSVTFDLRQYADRTNCRLSAWLRS